MSFIVFLLELLGKELTHASRIYPSFERVIFLIVTRGRDVILKILITLRLSRRSLALFPVIICGISLGISDPVVEIFTFNDVGWEEKQYSVSSAYLGQCLYRSFELVGLRRGLTAMCTSKGMPLSKTVESIALPRGASPVC